MIRSRWALVVAALVVAGCGTSFLGGECAVGAVERSGQCVAAGGASTASPTCRKNSECADDDVCLHGACTPVGACSVDLHCRCDAPRCTAGVCSGASLCAAGGPEPCSLNGDCPQHALCVAGGCQFGTECLGNGDCAVDQACFRQLCWDL